VDDVARRHVPGRGLDRLAKSDRRLLGRFSLHIGSAGARDGRGDTAAVAQLRIGCVGDRVEFELGYVSLKYL
jgi:hypothetical protein